MLEERDSTQCRYKKPLRMDSVRRNEREKGKDKDKERRKTGGERER